MEQDSLQSLLDSVGALAEMLNLFYETLKEKGFNDKQAFTLTQEYLRDTLQK